MASGTTVYDNFLIGALLAIPSQALARRVADAVVARGFTDYRATYAPVFQWCRPEGSRLTELAERAGVTKQSMGEIIDALEQRGYVERVPDPTDGRAILIRRTERGWEINRLAREVVDQVQQEWVQVLGPERFTALLEGLRQLGRALDASVGTPVGASSRSSAPTGATSADKKRRQM